MDANELAKALGIHSAIAELMVRRGIDDLDAAKAFLYPRKEDMIPALAIARMDEAAARIRSAIEEGERILVFGDYDCDGISATSILVHYLRSVGADVYYHIPRRANGYGLSETAVESVVEQYLPDLMVTVDCGVTSVVEVELAQDLGVDVIVTDHHEPQEELPDCIVVDPKLGNDERLRNICGAGVAMKLVEALAGKEVADSYLDIAAIATVADVVPLVGENRIIVHYGLKMLKNNPRKGLRALLRSCDLDEVTSGDIGFRVGPRINALGRLGDDADVVEVFLSDDDFVVHELVQKISAANTARQTLTKQLVTAAYRKLENYDLVNRRVIVLWDDQWEAGVLGLVASRLVGDFHRPVILLTKTNDTYRGSARSIPGVNIFTALSAVENRLISFGGHAGAAGMGVSPNSLQAFLDDLDAHLHAEYPADVFLPKCEADIVFDKTMRGDFFGELARLEPFGEGNPTPTFLVHSRECRIERIKDGDHVKCRMSDEVDLVGFGKSYLLAAQATGADLDYYCEYSNKVFQNRAYVQLSISNVVATGIEHVRDSAPAFGAYLKTVLYPTGEMGVRVSTLDKELTYLTGTHGILFVAFGVDAARDFIKTLTMAGKKNLLARVAVGKIDVNPLHTLLLAPTDTTGWQYYSSVVFLDAPLSKGYLAWVTKQAPNPELVLLPRYAFGERIRELHLDVADIEQTLRGIKRLEATKYHTLDEMCQALSGLGYNVADAYAHFYILYDLGIIAVGSGFHLQFRVTPVEPEKSRVYQNLMKLRQSAV